MKQPKIADFWLEGFMINKFSFLNPINPDKVNINLNFKPSGVFKSKENKFILTLKFDAKDENSKVKKSFINAEIISEFQFFSEVKFEQLPPYFYNNAIAITFPYIRSFISTLTLQAGVKILVLPLMNLTALGDVLKENTTLV